MNQTSSKETGGGQDARATWPGHSARSLCRSFSSQSLLGLLCLLLGSSSVFASDFDAANQQFKSGDFAGAAAAYEKILATEGPRAAVYYNLGNSYQSLKQYGPAILAYERARLLTPRDPDLLANLALARKAATAFEDSGRNPRLEAALNYLSRNEWSWLVAGAALLVGGLAVVGGAVKLPQRVRLLVVISSGMAGLAIVVGAAALYLRRDEADRGVVLAEGATVLLSPFEKAESLGTPGTGRSVHLGAKTGDFHYVEVAGTNLKGWLAAKDVAAVVGE
jgi:tetratricopeptide (TPR) repeat protein